MTSPRGPGSPQNLERWYLQVEGQFAGPFSSEEVRGLFQEKEILAHHLVSENLEAGPWITITQWLALPENLTPAAEPVGVATPELTVALDVPPLVDESRSTVAPSRAETKSSSPLGSLGGDSTPASPPDFEAALSLFETLRNLKAKPSGGSVAPAGNWASSNDRLQNRISHPTKAAASPPPVRATNSPSPPITEAQVSEERITRGLTPAQVSRIVRISIALLVLSGVIYAFPKFFNKANQDLDKVPEGLSKISTSPRVLTNKPNPIRSFNNPAILPPPRPPQGSSLANVPDTLTRPIKVQPDGSPESNEPDQQKEETQLQDENEAADTMGSSGKAGVPAAPAYVDPANGADYPTGEQSPSR